MRIERVILGKDDVEEALLDYIVKKSAGQLVGGKPKGIFIREIDESNSEFITMLVELLYW